MPHRNRLPLRFALLLLGLLTATPVAAQVRVKDIADIEGIRDNLLVGYGLVVGLNGTGDKLSSAAGGEHPRPAIGVADQEHRRRRRHR